MRRRNAIKNMIWRVGYNKIFARGDLIFNRGLEIFKKTEGLTRKGWRKNRWGL